MVDVLGMLVIPKGSAAGAMRLSASYSMAQVIVFAVLKEVDKELIGVVEVVDSISATGPFGRT